MATGAFAAPATPPALSPASSSSSSGGDARFAAYTQPPDLIHFDAPPAPCRPQVTELAMPVPPAAVALDAVAALDDVFLPELVGGDQLFPYGDFYGGLQDRALELSACYLPNMAEMWGAAAAADHAHAQPQGLCNTLT
uniref:Uncharacterized protein n=1 Tax=Arundo donax TaxID=35708 RepID=A0A0A9HGT3_ARUDO